ncbi:peptidase S8/S53 domain-containing protein [Mycena sp. CBHHK59/15]|nr:peptidase S8/S53 domain-containing protein [Mycena sp. CBHHK59/15]
MFVNLAVITTLSVASALAAPSPNANKLRRSAGNVVEDSYIVVLKVDASREHSLKALDDLVTTFDDIKQVEYTDWSVINAYSAKLSGASLDHVLNDPNVAYVEENGLVSINSGPTDGRAVYPDVVADEAFPQPRAELKASIPAMHKLHSRAGEGVDIYGLDTGILITHETFTGRASWGAVFGGYAQVDGNGHGTHTASTAAGVGFGPATSANVIAVRVLSDSGGGNYADVISGIDFATASAAASGRPSIVNLSLGGSISTALDTAVRNSIATGIHYTIASGNNFVPAQFISPARVTEAITVGAIDSNHVMAPFSNYGIAVDLSFLGIKVTAAWIGSNTATHTNNGTSMAAPGVAGIVATAISKHGNMSPADLQVQLKNAAIPDVIIDTSPENQGIPEETTTLRAVLY